MSELNQPHNLDISEIFNEFQQEIFRFVVARVRDRDVAMDITSDVFIKTYDFLEKHTIETVRPFLYKVAKNLIIDHSRKKKAVSLDAMMDDYHMDVSEKQTEKDVTHVALLNRVMDQLSPKYQDVLIKRYINELSLEEIAKVYGVSLNNASVLSHRALAKAQEVYQKISQTYEYF